jgi:aryl-alcohol dehydrogenase (NADP+)
MKYRNLGESGLKVSRICLGMMSYGDPGWREWVLAEEDARPFVRRAIELGINFFDTADMYSKGVSEEVTGRLLEEYARRDELVIATKVFHPLDDDPNGRGLSRKHILASIDRSLQRLGTEYVDLYQIHRWDPSSPIEETLEALHDVVKAGKALYIGASSMFAWQFAKSLYLAEQHGWTRFVSMQNHYNLLYREEEREMLPLCREEGIGVIPWSPLARGLLAGNRRGDLEGDTVRSRSDDFIHKLYEASDLKTVDSVAKVAEERGVSSAQVALAWLLHQEGVVAPIIGATRLEHLEEAVTAVDLKLDEGELARLEESYQPHSVRGHQ